MSFRKEDGVSSLCQKALHIITELCFAGQVEWDKCSGIFPADRSSQGGGGTGKHKDPRLLLPGQGAFSGQTSWLELVWPGLGDLLVGFVVACTCWVSAPRLLSRSPTCCSGVPGTLACPAGCSRITQPGRRICGWPQRT